MRKAVEEEYFNRRRESELKKNFQKRIDYKKPFEKPQVVKPNEVWSIDFTFVSILGFKFAICEIYDIYSQTYYAMEVGETPDEQLAKKAFLIALRNSQAVPLRCILSDNDSSFLGEEFQELLKSQKVEHKTIPPGSPWYNGEIESGNRDLKKALLTKALQETCKNVEITLKGSSREVVETFVKKKCNETRILLNEDIPRMKFKTTPQKVLEGKVEEQQEKQRKFIEMKKNQRKQRMDKLKTGVIKSKVKTLVEKVKMLWKKEVKDMSNDEIYVLNETINERYNAIIA